MVKTLRLVGVCALSLVLSSCFFGPNRLWGGPSATRGAGEGGGASPLNIPVAVVASAVSRANGNCFAVCSAGTTCNEKTGYCETIPCHGRCGARERCETSGGYERCVPQSPDLEIQGANGETRRIPLASPSPERTP